jgi:hypothetical protein
MVGRGAGIGDRPRLDVIDALAALKAADLVHRCQDFVFTSRAAYVVSPVEP